MPRHIRDFYVTSARKFKLNNDFSCSDNKKNSRNLPTENMFCAITSLLVKFRKSLHRWLLKMTLQKKIRDLFWDFTAVRTSRKFYLNLVHFKVFFAWEETSKLNFFFARMLDQKVCIWLWPYAAWDGLCQVLNETDGSKWSQNATLDFCTTILASFLR